MSGGEKVLIAGVVGVGVFAYLKFRSNQQTNLPPSAYAPPTIKAQVSLAGAPPALQPLQGPASNAVHNLNKALGLAPGIQADWTRNPDGTYTDGSNCKITLSPDGKTYTRKCPGGTAIQHEISSAVSSLSKEIGGFFS
jgi:hypothetical protein